MMKTVELFQPLNELIQTEKDSEVAKLLQKVQAIRLDSSGITAIISDLRSLLENRDIDRYDEKSAYYNFLLAYAYAVSGKIDSAIQEIENAVYGFKYFGNERDWQQAMSTWVHGLLLCEQRQYDSAIAKMEEARKTISKLADHRKNRGDYKELEYYQSIIMLIDANLKKTGELNDITPKDNSSYNPKKSEKQQHVRVTPVPEHKIKLAQPNHTDKQQEIKQTGDYISVPWLPIYRSVSAGPSGIVIMDSPSKAYVTLNTIEIFDIPYNLHSIKKNSMTDRQISLIHGFTYGLVKVEGESMSASQPIAINNGDYVLFTKQPNAEDNDILIASRALSSGDLAYMVKRYNKKERLFLSEYKEATTYPPIEISQDNQILGVVIAIAKIAEEIN